jgi:MFS family permease
VERGTAFGWYLLGYYVGPAFASIIGGVIEQYYGRRWIFYVLDILGLVTLFFIIFFLPETMRMRYVEGIDEKGRLTWKKAKSRVADVNPAAPIFLIRYPSIGLIVSSCAITAGAQYLIAAVHPWAYKAVYNFTALEVGVSFTGMAFGTILGSQFSGRFSDYITRILGKNNRETTPEMRLFASLPATTLLIPLSTLAYGWLLWAKAHWIWPLVAITVCK